MGGVGIGVCAVLVCQLLLLAGCNASEDVRLDLRASAGRVQAYQTWLKEIEQKNSRGEAHLPLWASAHGASDGHISGAHVPVTLAADGDVLAALESRKARKLLRYISIDDVKPAAVRGSNSEKPVNIAREAAKLAEVATAASYRNGRYR